MKLTRLIAVPFALAADVCTLGNMGNRSFTQQVFDAERREQQEKEAIDALNALTALLRALSK